MTDAPLYAKVGEKDWHDLNVYFNGHLSAGWIEVDVLGCWGVRYAEDEHGKPILRDDILQTEKVYGHFRLERVVTKKFESDLRFLDNAVQRAIQSSKKYVDGQVKFAKKKRRRDP